jgi:hypothetical protein
MLKPAVKKEDKEPRRCEVCGVVLKLTYGRRCNLCDWAMDGGEDDEPPF